MKILIILWALSLAILVLLDIALFFEEELEINPRVFKIVGFSSLGVSATSGAGVLWGCRK